MKTKIILKKFTDSSSGVVHITHAKSPARPKASPLRMSDSVRRFAARQAKRAERFRESLRRRATAPFISAIPYHRWGINE